MKQTVLQTAKEMGKEIWQEASKTFKDLYEPSKDFVKEAVWPLAKQNWLVFLSVFIGLVFFLNLLSPKHHDSHTEKKIQPRRIIAQPVNKNSRAYRRAERQKAKEQEDRLYEEANGNFNQSSDYPSVEEEAYPGEPPNNEKQFGQGVIDKLPGVSHSLLQGIDTLDNKVADTIVKMVRVSHYNPTGNHMANGEYPYRGATAISDRNIPFGTKVIINSRLFTVKDRTASWVHEKLFPDAPGLLTTVDVFGRFTSDRFNEATLIIDRADLKKWLAKRNRRFNLLKKL